MVTVRNPYQDKNIGIVCHCDIKGQILSLFTHSDVIMMSKRQQKQVIDNF